MNPRPFAASTAVTATEAQYFELRTYTTLYGDQKRLLDTFLREAAIPAWNRMGINPVGVFTPRYGLSDPSVMVLLPHPSLASVENVTGALLKDQQFLQDGRAFLEADSSNASFFRMESSLLKAFSVMPSVDVPKAVQGVKDRIFEMRVYDSHNEIAAQKKIEMINTTGVVDVFLETGLHPVFFGETLIGARLPNLVYMLAFQDMKERDENWQKFMNSDGWKQIAPIEKYKDTVCNISDIIYQPKGYSQI
jgi:hypothetical protein